MEVAPKSWATTAISLTTGGSSRKHQQFRAFIVNFWITFFPNALTSQATFEVQGCAENICRSLYSASINS